MRERERETRKRNKVEEKTIRKNKEEKERRILPMIQLLRFYWLMTQYDHQYLKCPVS